MIRNGVWQRDFEISIHEIDFQGNFGIPQLMRLVFRASHQHILHLGISGENFAKNGQPFNWILARSVLNLAPAHQWMAEQDHVTVRTWHSGLERLFVTRQFEVLNNDLQVIATGKTYWMFIDYDRKCPVKIPDPARKIDSSGGVVDQYREIPASDRAESELKFETRLSEVFAGSGHVNNTSYLQWFLDSIPAESWNKATLTKLEINYLKEIWPNEQVVVQIQSTPDGYLHQVRKAQDGSLAAISKTYWVPRS